MLWISSNYMDAQLDDAFLDFITIDLLNDKCFIDLQLKIIYN